MRRAHAQPRAPTLFTARVFFHAVNAISGRCGRNESSCAAAPARDAGHHAHAAAPDDDGGRGRRRAVAAPPPAERRRTTTAERRRAANQLASIPSVAGIVIAALSFTAALVWTIIKCNTPKRASAAEIRRAAGGHADLTEQGPMGTELGTMGDAGDDGVRSAERL